VTRKDVNYILAITLTVSIIVTGILGYIQSELELRRFFPHRYAAYTTLFLASAHLCLNFGKLWRYIRGPRGGRDDS